MVYDTHTHAWGPPTPDHPWTNGPLVENFASHFSTDIIYTAEKLLADMDEAGVDDAVVQIMAHTSQLDQALELVEAYPELRYTFDHFAHADAADDPAESYAGFEPLAEYDNVTVKLSEIAHTSNEEFPYEDAHDHVRWFLDTFGRERVLWGSDFPNVSHPEFGRMSYGETQSWLNEVSFLSDADRRWLVDDAARSFLEG